MSFPIMAIEDFVDTCKLLYVIHNPLNYADEAQLSKWRKSLCVHLMHIKFFNVYFDPLVYLSRHMYM